MTEVSKNKQNFRNAITEEIPYIEEGLDTITLRIKDEDVWKKILHNSMLVPYKKMEITSPRPLNNNLQHGIFLTDLNLEDTLFPYKKMEITNFRPTNDNLQSGISLTDANRENTLFPYKKMKITSFRLTNDNLNGMFLTDVNLENMLVLIKKRTKKIYESVARQSFFQDNHYIFRFPDDMGTESAYKLIRASGVCADIESVSFHFDIPKKVMRQREDIRRPLMEAVYWAKKTS